MSRYRTVLAFWTGLALLLMVPSVVRAQSDRGQSDLSNWFSPKLGLLEPGVSYQGMVLPAQNVNQQPTSLGFIRQDFGLHVPLWQDEVDEWAASAKVRTEFFQGHAILPNTLQPFPSDLYDVRLGTTYRHSFDDGWIAGGGLTIGSASDQPFSTINEVTVAANAFLRVPQGERNAWLFSLNYSTNSEFLAGIPIPGVAYFYNPADWVQVTIGIPFCSVQIHPDEDWALSLSYALLTTVHARLSYRILPGFKAYVGFDTENESYFPANRFDDRERLFYYDDRATVGLQYILNENVHFDLSTGYEFNRFYFEGRSYSDRHFNRIDLGDGPFAAFKVSLQF